MIECGALSNRHVRLEPLSVDHVPLLSAAALRDRSTFGLAPVPADPEGVAIYVESALAERSGGRATPFAIRRTRTDEIVGSIRFMSFEWWSWPRGAVSVPGEPRERDRGDAPDVCEIGHAWLTPSAQRTEVFTATCALMMIHAFSVWSVHRLVLKTDARNERSRAAITRLGATFEGILRQHLPAADGVIRDTAMFSVLPGEWPAIHAVLEAKLEHLGDAA